MKTQIYKRTKSDVLLGRLLRLSIKTDLPLKKDVTKKLSKSVMVLLGLTSAETDAGIYLKKLSVWEQQLW